GGVQRRRTDSATLQTKHSALSGNAGIRQACASVLRAVSPSAGDTARAGANHDSAPAPDAGVTAGLDHTETFAPTRRASYLSVHPPVADNSHRLHSEADRYAPSGAGTAILPAPGQ